MGGQRVNGRLIGGGGGRGGGRPHSHAGGGAAAMSDRRARGRGGGGGVGRGIGGGGWPQRDEPAAGSSMRQQRHHPGGGEGSGGDTGGSSSVRAPAPGEQLQPRSNGWQRKRGGSGGEGWRGTSLPFDAGGAVAGVGQRAGDPFACRGRWGIRLQSAVMRIGG